MISFGWCLYTERHAGKITWFGRVYRIWLSKDIFRGFNIPFTYQNRLQEHEDDNER